MVSVLCKKRTTVVHPSTIMFTTMIKIMIPAIAPARKHNVQSMIVSWGAGWLNS
jgi:hypothetical protein